MQILKLKGFLFEPSDPAIYDRDSKTVLELCGKLGYKINELIDEYNRFYEEMLEKYDEAYEYMVTNLPLIVAEQLPAVASEVMQELYGQTLEDMIRDIQNLQGDIVEILARIHSYQGIAEMKAQGNFIPVGSYVKTLYRTTEGDKGGATYVIVDELETGEVANDNDIIAIGTDDPTTKWAKMVPGDIVYSASFLTLQDAIDYAYKNKRDVYVTGYHDIQTDLVIPFDSETSEVLIHIIGDENDQPSIQMSGGQIKQTSGAYQVNFAFKNIRFIGGHSTDSLFDLTPGVGVTQSENGVIFDSCLFVSHLVSFNQIHEIIFENCHFIDYEVNTDLSSNIFFNNCTFQNTNDGVGGKLYLKRSANINFDECVFNNDNATILEIDSSNNIYVLNSNIYNSVNAGRPITLYDSKDSVFQNVMIYGTGNSNFTGAIYCEDCINIKFSNVTCNMEMTGLYAIDYKGGSKPIVSNLYCNNCNLVNLYNVEGATIKGYGNPNNKSIVSVTGTSTDNIVELASESDLSYVSGSINISIPTEVRQGDSTLMNTLTGYEGRIFYNTSLFSTMIYHNNAWVSLAPNLLPDDNVIHQLDFGVELVGSSDRTTLDYRFIDGTNKTMVIQILNNMIVNNETIYFFVNNSDELLNIYKIKLNGYDSVSGHYERIDVFVNYNLGDDYTIVNGDRYLGMEDYNLTYTNDLVSDIARGYSSRLNTYNVGGGGSSNAYYDYFPTNTNTHIYFNYNSTTASHPLEFGNTTDKNNFIDILNDAWTKQYTTGFVIAFHDHGGFLRLLNVDYAMYDPTNSSSTIWISSFVSFEYHNSTTYGLNNDGSAVRFISINVSTNSVDTITDITSSSFTKNNAGLPLGVFNSQAYTPTGDYNPATKLYVDTHALEQTDDLSTPDASIMGKIVAYNGTSNQYVTKGHIYQVKYNFISGDYYWEEVDMTPTIEDLLSYVRCDVGTIITNSMSGNSYFRRYGHLYTLMLFVQLTTAVSSSVGNAVGLLGFPLDFNPSTSTANASRVIYGAATQNSSSTSTLFNVYGILTNLNNPNQEKEVLISTESLTGSVNDIICINLTWTI